MICNLNPENYYSQRNNKNNPMEACGPTSRIMFYLGNKIPIHPAPLGKSYDDWFMELLNTPEANQYAKLHYPQLIKDYKPNEIHGMYPNYLDKLVTVGAMSCSIFDDSLTYDVAIKYVNAGKVLMVSGQFQGQSGPIKGHIFCIIGYDDGYLVIADPYGNFHTNYKSDKGYKVLMSKAEFEVHVKPANAMRKYVHYPI